ncbi:Fic family protein [Patescibacteria group bacterium]|nr:Fic family protein [Patescibacteria group bacterium]MBU1674047.1 Fic family protein [Patescibacteria group bacterium]MBU1963195.1 Fic family protein [Patescibacteria group bacterium]
MAKITKRQLEILDFIRKKGPVQNQLIKDHLEGIFGILARVTVVRDLDNLLQAGLIIKEGKGRAVKYSEKMTNKLLSYFDIDEYFKLGPDERQLAFSSFNFNVFNNLKNLFSQEEINSLIEINNTYQKSVEKLSATALKKEFERLTIELSWKSSQIEGNTYSLIDTEILIKEKKEAKGHDKEEAIMILNHKKAFDFILDKKNNFKKLNLAKIENIHQLLIKDLDVATGLRKRPVGIIGTGYKPLDNQFQIKEAMEKMIKKVNGSADPFSKALIVILLISYVQPFEDGNKRTARLMGDAMLLAHNACPLSFRSVDEGEYKKAMILFYEQNNVRFFKELFIQQFKFAIDNYFK